MIGEVSSETLQYRAHLNQLGHIGQSLEGFIVDEGVVRQVLGKIVKGIPQSLHAVRGTLDNLLLSGEQRGHGQFLLDTQFFKHA